MTASLSMSQAFVCWLALYCLLPAVSTLLSLPERNSLTENCLYLFYFISMRVFFFCVYLCTLCAWCPQNSDEYIGSLELELKSSYELPFGCWNLNLGPLQEQQLLLIIESSLQPPGMNSMVTYYELHGSFCSIITM